MESRTGGAKRLIVLDASVIVSAAFRRGSHPRLALDRAVERGLIALSRPVLAEYEDVLGRPKFSHVLTQAMRDDVISALASAAQWYVPTVSVTDCRDPHDNKYLELALAAQASVLVSSDMDLLALTPWRGMQILRPAAYLALP